MYYLIPYDGPKPQLLLLLRHEEEGIMTTLISLDFSGIELIVCVHHLLVVCGFRQKLDQEVPLRKLQQDPENNSNNSSSNRRSGNTLHRH
jgi:hypothetical protein